MTAQSKQVAGFATTISQEEARLYITDSKTLNDMLMRNGYYCPKLKSAIMSFAFMDGVREGDYWLP